MKVESTVKPKQVKILGNKVLVRSNIELVNKENPDGEINKMYQYDEVKFDKDEYIEKQSEQQTFDVKKELTLKEKIKQYRWNKQKWFTYDGYTQRFTEYDIVRMDTAIQGLEKGVKSEIEWAYPVEGDYVTVTEPQYFIDMKLTGFENENILRNIEKQLLNDETVTNDNYKEKFDELLG